MAKLESAGAGETEPMLAKDMETQLGADSQAGDGGPSISINRPAYTHNDMVAAFNLRWEAEMRLKEKMKKCVEDQLACTAECWRERVFRFFPFIKIMRDYNWKKWLLLDFISGVSVGVIHIPQGMGFALLTSLPPVFGLYSSFFPVLIYFFFASSRHLSMGTMALISLMIGAIVNREVEKLGFDLAPVGENSTMTENESLVIQNRIEEVQLGTAVSVSLLVGAFQFLMGIVGLGAVATFMSMPFIGSFLTAAAVHIITSQIPSALGIKIPGHPGIFKVPLTFYEIFAHITETNISALVTTLISLLVLIVMKEIINERCRHRIKVPIPAELLVVIAATLISHYCGLNELYGLKIVGPIPSGIPAPKVPPMNNVTTYIGDALIISIISFAISISMAKLMAKKHDYAIDVNQELFAYGLCHGISAFFNCFAGAQAPPRTLVHDSVGGKSQVHSLVSCVMVLLVCLFLGQLFFSLPIPALAAIIIVALLPLFKQFQQLPILWRVNKYDFLVWIITFFCVVILDVITGLIIGMGTSIFFVVFQAHWASGNSLVSINDTDVYLTKDRLLSDSIFEYPGIQVFRFNAPLFFVNVEKFKAQLYQKVVMCQRAHTEPVGGQVISMTTVGENSPRDTDANSSESAEQISAPNGSQDTQMNNHIPKAGHRKPGSIILECAAISYIDIMGVNMLKMIRADLSKLEIMFSLASVSSSMAKKLQAAGAVSFVDDDKIPSMFTIYPTVHDAVAMETIHSKKRKFNV